MSTATLATRLLDRAVGRYGYRVVPEAVLHDWQKNFTERRPRRTPGRSLPEGAETYLRADHPRLRELAARYAAFDKRVTSPLVWREGHITEEDLVYFRGDNGYVWQLRGPNTDPAAYALTTYYVRSCDPLQLLERLEEDGLFGAVVFEVAGRTVSRDLLDSIVEISFLHRYLGLGLPGRHFGVLDIGAGYGRLAHRMVCGVPGVETYLCTDAFPESTFVSDYYLGFRKLKKKARAVPLDEIDEALSRTPVNLAIDIHTFSECTLEAVDWWLALMAKHRVRYLMVVPNGRDHGGQKLLTHEGRDMRGVIEKYGYREIAMDPKYEDPVVQQYGVSPTCHYLFELRQPAARAAIPLPHVRMEAEH